MDLNALMVAAAAVAPAVALAVWAQAQMARADQELRAFVLAEQKGFGAQALRRLGS